MLMGGFTCFAQPKDMVTRSNQAAQQAKAGKTTEAANTARDAVMNSTFTGSSATSNNLAGAIKAKVEEKVKEQSSSPAPSSTPSTKPSTGTKDNGTPSTTPTPSAKPADNKTGKK